MLMRGVLVVIQKSWPKGYGRVGIKILMISSGKPKTMQNHIGYTLNGLNLKGLKTSNESGKEDLPGSIRPFGWTEERPSTKAIIKKSRTSPIKVALKYFKGSQEISASFLNEMKIHYQLYLNGGFLRFYGITKDPQTNEFIMVSELVNNGNLRNLLTRNFNNIMWSKKISFLKCMILDVNKLHELEYCHKNLHSGNVLLENSASFLTDFGLSGPANRSSNGVYGVLPYVAPEVLRGKPYTTAADIYSFGIIMIEMSNGKPPFYDRKHNDDLMMAICNGLRPEFGKGTPECYKELSYRCLSDDPDQRPTANELYDIMWEWEECIRGRRYGDESIREAFKKADREIPNMITSYKIHPDAVFTSKRLK